LRRTVAETVAEGLLWRLLRRLFAETVAETVAETAAEAVAEAIGPCFFFLPLLLPYTGSKYNIIRWRPVRIKGVFRNRNLGQ